MSVKTELEKGLVRGIGPAVVTMKQALYLVLSRVRAAEEHVDKGEIAAAMGTLHGLDADIQALDVMCKAIKEVFRMSQYPPAVEELLPVQQHPFPIGTPVHVVDVEDGFGYDGVIADRRIEYKVEFERSPASKGFEWVAAGRVSLI